MEKNNKDKIKFYARRHKKKFSDLDLLILKKANEIRNTNNYKRALEWIKEKDYFSDAQIRKIFIFPDDMSDITKRLEGNGVINVLSAEGSIDYIRGAYRVFIGKSDEQIAELYKMKRKSEWKETIKSIIGLGSVGIIGICAVAGLITCSTSFWKSHNISNSPSTYHSPTGGYAGSIEQEEQLRMADEYSLTDEEKAIKDEYEKEVDRQLKK